MGPREQRGLQGDPRYPVALPHALYALAAPGEMAAAVDQLLEPPAGYDHERYPHDRASYAEGAAQGGGEAQGHAGDDPDPHVQSSRGGRGEELQELVHWAGPLFRKGCSGYHEG
jgi:hypothetical protein